MEIPTNEIIEKLESLLTGGHEGSVALDAIDVIKAQALEIRELQLVIVRLRDESSAGVSPHVSP